ncbi:MAG: SDR family NAD(P)-dependent oxidoreductase [Pseudomonadota bacterium]
MPLMKNKEAIVNVSSVNAVSPGPMQGVYPATKAALVNMTKTLSRELVAATRKRLQAPYSTWYRMLLLFPIQAMDLLGRKLGMDKGLVFKSLLDDMEATVASVREVPLLAPMAEILHGSVSALGKTAMGMGGAAMSEKYASAFAHALPFLEVIGDVTVGWLHLWRARKASQSLEKDLSRKDRAF